MGSPAIITKADCYLIQQLSYDAWGNRRDPLTWESLSSNTTLPESLIDRGFTFHEHLYPFTLINMNGRVYDPLVGRFLSPDPFVQDISNSQSYNRYSYCFNNPFKYTDPDGEIALVDDLVLGLIGGTINWLQNGAQFNGHGAAYFGVGFVGGALSEYITPVGAAALVGSGNSTLGSYYSTGHVDPGAVIQGAVTSGIVSGLTMGLGQSLAPFANNALSGIASPVLRGAITQGVIGTGLGAIGGGLGSVMNEGNFWEGAGQGALWGGGIGFATGAYDGYQYARARYLSPWTGRSTLPPLTPLKPIEGYVTYNSGYNDPSEIQLPNRLSHYTPDDPSNWTTLGTVPDRPIYLTPNSELSRVGALNDLALPRTPNFRIDINGAILDPNKIMLIRRVTGNVYGQGGGGWEIIYKGSLNLNKANVTITSLP